MLGLHKAHSFDLLEVLWFNFSPNVYRASAGVFCLMSRALSLDDCCISTTGTWLHGGQCLLELAQLHTEPHRDHGLKISDKSFADAVQWFPALSWVWCRTEKEDESLITIRKITVLAQDLRPTSSTAVAGQTEHFPAPTGTNILVPAMTLE